MIQSTKKNWLLLLSVLWRASSQTKVLFFPVVFPLLVSADRLVDWTAAWLRHFQTGQIKTFNRPHLPEFSNTNRHYLQSIPPKKCTTCSLQKKTWASLDIPLFDYIIFNKQHKANIFKRKGSFFLFCGLLSSGKKSLPLFFLGEKEISLCRGKQEKEINKKGEISGWR